MWEALQEPGTPEVPGSYYVWECVQFFRLEFDIKGVRILFADVVNFTPMSA